MSPLRPIQLGAGEEGLVDPRLGSRSVCLAVLMREPTPPPPIVAHDCLDVVVRIADLITFGAVAHFEDHAIPRRSVFQVMCGAARWESCRHAWAEFRLPCVSKQCGLAFNHIDKFVLTRVR